MKKISFILLCAIITSVLSCSKKNDPPFSIEQYYGSFAGLGTERQMFAGGGSTNPAPFNIEIEISGGNTREEINILFEGHAGRAAVADRKFSIIDSANSVGVVFRGTGEFLADNKIEVILTRVIPIPPQSTSAVVYRGTVEKQ